MGSARQPARVMEPKIIINGTELTTAQTMTVRVAIGDFSFSLMRNGLGDDEQGREMTRLYRERIAELNKIIHG